MNLPDFFNTDSDAIIVGKTDILHLTFKCQGSTAFILLVYIGVKSYKKSKEEI